MKTNGSVPQVHTCLADIPDAAKGGAVAIGTFDGIHAGHRAVLTAATDTAHREKIPPCVLVFDPPARRFFNPDTPPLRLMGPGLQDQELGVLGIKHVFRLPFNAQLRDMSPDTFVKTLLCDQLKVRAVAFGSDFCFGKNRAGTAYSMRELGQKHGFQTLIIDTIMSGAGKISSSRIREHVRAGEMERATALLGRPYTVDGMIVKGSGDGRRLGWPTANIQVTDMLSPPFGIYAARAMIGDHAQWQEGVAYHGCAPTLGKREPFLETHLFDYSGEDLYGQALRLALYSWLRPDHKFPDLDSLRIQIAQDTEKAKQVLQAGGPLPRPLLAKFA